MLVLISYDVSTETPAGKKRLRKVAKNVLTMGREFKTQFLSVFWITRNARCYNTNS